MKKYLFASAMSLSVLVAAPAFAAPGIVGAAATHTEVDVLGFEGDGAAYNIFGGYVQPLSEGLALQVDGDVTFTDVDGAEDETVLSGAAHLYHGSETGKVGGFAGFSNADEYTVWSAGAEGQLFLEQVNLGGALGYFNVEDLDVDGFGVSGTATFFATDNFALSGTAGYASAEIEDLDVDLDGWNVGVGAEYQFAAAPVSVFAAYSRTDIEDVDLEADSFSIGVAYSFGSATLKERERSGPSLGGLGGLAGMFAF